MTSSSRLPDPDAFLGELPWLRRLALRLTGNPDDAEDLAQQAWLQAAQARGPDGSVRGWLGAIVRNLHRSNHRSDSRRRAREAAVPVHEPESATDEIAERLEAHRALLQAVDQLDEPQRRVITQHYLYGLSMKEIAARDELPRSTVETRLRRAREQLRQKLDRDFGSRGAWFGLLGPLPAFPSPLAPTAPASADAPAAIASLGTVAGGATLAVTAKILTTTGLLAAAAFLAVALWPDSGPPPSDGDRDAPPPSERSAANQAAEATDVDSKTSRSLAASQPGADEPPSVVARAPNLELLCLDPMGEPVADIAFRRVGVQQNGLEMREDGGSGEELGVSDAEGRLTVPGTGGLAQLDPEHRGNQGWQLVLQPQLTAYSDEGADSRRVAVVARSIELGGTLRSELGEALQQPQVALVLPDNWQSRLPYLLTTGRVPSFSVTPDATDRFRITVPFVPGAKLSATAVAHEVRETEVTELGRLDLDLVLKPVIEHWTLTGSVVDQMGSPMSGMLVVSELGSARSDEAGAFQLEVDGRSPPAVLHGIGEGFQPTTTEVPKAAPGSRRIDGLRIVMDRPALWIRGRVLDDEGQPLAQARVWFEQGTNLGWQRIFPVQAENRSAGTDMLWYTVFTDDEGHFELGGLLEKNYRLHAAHPLTTLEVAASKPVPAGATGVELRLDSSLARPPVTGVVVDRSGKPIPDAAVAYQRTGHTLTDQNGRHYITHLRAKSVRTGAEGRFSMEGLPQNRGGQLRFGAKGFTGEERALVADKPASPFRIVLYREFVVNVDLRDASQGDRVSFHDESGEAIQIVRVTSDMNYVDRGADLVDGRVTLQVSGRAVQARLWKAGEEVHSVPVRFSGDDPISLRF